MNKAEQVALATAALDAERGGPPLTFSVPESNANANGDTSPPSASDQAAAATVTPTPTGDTQPTETAGPDVSTTTPEPIEFPAWVQERSKEALRGLPKEAREAVIADMDAKRVSLERDATEKWEKIAEERRDAAKWRSIVNDPEKGPKVLDVLEAPAATPAVDPRISKLKEVLGEEAAAVVVDLMSATAEEKAKAIVHEKVEAPVEHVKHVNDAAFAYAKKMGWSDDEFKAARTAVGVSLGWTPENENAPYDHLTPQNVATYLTLAVNTARANPKQTPAVSPPKPPVAKPASVQSNGMAQDTKYVPPWVRENRAPRPGERAAETMRRAGMTGADIDRLIQMS